MVGDADGAAATPMVLMVPQHRRWCANGRAGGTMVSPMAPSTADGPRLGQWRRCQLCSGTAHCATARSMALVVAWYMVRRHSRWGPATADGAVAPLMVPQHGRWCIRTANGARAALVGAGGTADGWGWHGQRRCATAKRCSGTDDSATVSLHPAPPPLLPNQQTAHMYVHNIISTCVPLFGVRQVQNRIADRGAGNVMCPPTIASHVGTDLYSSIPAAYAYTCVRLFVFVCISPSLCFPVWPCGRVMWSCGIVVLLCGCAVVRLCSCGVVWH